MLLKGYVPETSWACTRCLQLLHTFLHLLILMMSLFQFHHFQWPFSAIWYVDLTVVLSFVHYSVVPFAMPFLAHCTSNGVYMNPGWCLFWHSADSSDIFHVWGIGITSRVQTLSCEKKKRQKRDSIGRYLAAIWPLFGPNTVFEAAIWRAHDEKRFPASCI